MKQLIKRAKRGDADAFTELVQSQMQNLYKTAYAYLGNDEDAGDAISETILTCYEKLYQLKEDSYFRTWLTRILINKCKDILRTRQRIVPVETIPERTAGDCGYENAEWKEALGILEKKYRVVMILHYVEELSAGEIGGLLGLPESTVRTRLSRGKKQLAAAFGEKGEALHG